MYGVGIVDDIAYYIQNDSALIVYNIFLFQQNIPISVTHVEWHNYTKSIACLIHLLLSFIKLSNNKCGPGGEAEIFKSFNNSLPSNFVS